MTQQNRNIEIAIEQRARNCKIGEGGGLACHISGRETNDILLRVEVVLLLELGLYSRRTKITHTREVRHKSIQGDAMRNMMHETWQDDMCKVACGQN